MNPMRMNLMASIQGAGLGMLRKTPSNGEDGGDSEPSKASAAAPRPPPPGPPAPRAATPGPPPRAPPPPAMSMQDAIKAKSASVSVVV
jgi:hypothetical protein